MSKENFYKNKVLWCPACDQGWVEIVKDTKTGVLFCCCSECEAEWNEPANIRNGNGTRKFRNICEPTEDEIDSMGWKKYIL